MEMAFRNLENYNSQTGDKMEQIRLNKYLAECGVCSRREADRLIEQGRVAVNGQVAVMGTKVTLEDEVAVNKKIIAGRKKTVVLAFNKPVGVTCTEKDRHAEKIISDIIKYPTRVTYAGRLDKDSEGLLILTNDGDLIEAMMRGSNRHEKEYIVKVNKEITKEFLQNMEKGVFLKELNLTTRPCEIKQIGKYTFNIILTQGVNRQIRRMCKAFSYDVVSLQRIRIMNIKLGSIKTGKYNEITGEILEELYQLCGISMKKT